MEEKATPASKALKPWLKKASVVINAILALTLAGTLMLFYFLQTEMDGIWGTILSTLLVVGGTLVVLFWLAVNHVMQKFGEGDMEAAERRVRNRLVSLGGPSWIVRSACGKGLVVCMRSVPLVEAAEKAVVGAFTPCMIIFVTEDQFPEVPV